MANQNPATILDNPYILTALDDRDAVLDAISGVV